jgi:GT2 family glycosyltransferase
MEREQSLAIASADLMRRADVSVAIATVDRPGGLQRCLDGILGGDLLPTEILVIDQGSMSETAAVVRAASSASCPISYAPQERLGLSASRNLAVALARCRTVAVTDDDCVPDPAWVAVIEQVLDTDGALAGMTGPVLPLPPDGDNIYASSSRTSRVPAEFTGKASPWLVGTGGNFAARRDWFQRIGGYDLRLGSGSAGMAGEDMDVIYRFLLAGARLRYEPGAVVRHRRKSHSARLATCWGYGHGMGAFCGLWSRRGDAFTLSLLAMWLAEHVWALAGAIRKRRSWDCQQESLRLRGVWPGLAYGLRVGTRRGPRSLLSRDGLAAA